MATNIIDFLKSPITLIGTAIFVVIAYVLRETFGSIISSLVFSKLEADMGIKEAQVIAAISGQAVPLCIAAILAYVLFKLVQKREKQIAEEKIAELTRQIVPVMQNDLSPPTIVTGTGEPFETTNDAPNGRLHRTVGVVIRNNRPHHHLSNCKFHVAYRLADNSTKSIQLRGEFDVPPGGETPIPVAHYNETVKAARQIPDVPRQSSIWFCFVPQGYGGFQDMPPADRKHAITLTLKCADSIVVERVGILWVDESGRLRLDQA